MRSNPIFIDFVSSPLPLPASYFLHCLSFLPVPRPPPDPQSAGILCWPAQLACCDAPALARPSCPAHPGMASCLQCSFQCACHQPHNEVKIIFLVVVINNVCHPAWLSSLFQETLFFAPDYTALLSFVVPPTTAPTTFLRNSSL